MHRLAATDCVFADDETQICRLNAPRLRCIEDVLANSATSYWLKAAIRSLMDRDPLAVLNDAFALAALIEERLRISIGIDEGTPAIGSDAISEEEGRRSKTLQNTNRSSNHTIR